MSYAYDSYLKEHIGNISRGLHWMVDHLDFQKLGIDGFQTGNVILRVDEHDRSKYGKKNMTLTTLTLTEETEVIRL